MAVTSIPTMLASLKSGISAANSNQDKKTTTLSRIRTDPETISCKEGMLPVMVLCNSRVVVSKEMQTSIVVKLPICQNPFCHHPCSTVEMVSSTAQPYVN